MLIVTAEQVHEICGWPELVAALYRAHQKPPPLTGVESLTAKLRGHTQTYLNLPAMIPGEAFGTKMVTVVPDNPDRHPDVPAIQALYTLFDGETGTPRAVIDGTSLTYRKTAADSALATSLLAREDAATLVMVGAGGLSPWLAQAHMAMRPSIERVLVWNRTPRRAEAVAANLRGNGVAAHGVTGLEDAVREADIVSCCTAAAEPLIQGDWLRPGAHVDLVGGFTPEMREVDDAAVVRARLFADADWNIDGCGDFCDPIARGVIEREKIEADLYGLCRQGHSAHRRKDDDITMFKNGGGGHLDLYTALFIVRSLETLS